MAKKIKSVPVEEEAVEIKVTEPQADSDEAEATDGAGDEQAQDDNGSDSSEDDGASIEVKAKGSAKAVRNAFTRLGGGGVRRVAPPQEEIEELEDAYQDEALELVAKLLQDPRNKVAVIRTYPRRVLGRNCAVQVDEYPCPTTIEQIERDVFERFGGESYNLMVHPNSPSGRHKILGAYPITHPTMKEPIFEDDDQQQQQEEMSFDPRGQISDGSDPTAGEVDDPMALAENMMKRKAKLLHQKANLKQAEQAVKSMEDDERNRGREDDPVIRAMAERFDRQLAEVKQLLMQQAQQARPPIQDNTLLVELMRGNQAQFAAMMAAMQSSQASTMNAMAQLSQGGKKADSVDDQLDRLVKLKEAFGGDDSRVKRLEQMLFDVALDKIEGGGESGSSDDDPIKFGIKQLTPVLKGYLEKQGNNQKEMTAEEVRRIHDEAATKAGKDLAAQWEKEGKLVRVPMPKQPAAQQPSPQPQDATEQEGDDMQTPPGPKSPGYDRNKAVDFVLSTIIDDIGHGCPQDSYAVGDCLDRLDSEMLDKLLEISTGADLEGLMRPYADQAKVDFIKESGKDPAIKSYLTRVVVTVQDVYRRQTRPADPQKMAQANQPSPKP